MTSHITKEQYDKFISTIKKEFPEWDENISNLSIVVKGSFENVDTQKIKEIVDKAISKIARRNENK